ncbi:hypothetical protein [Streptomyces cuspidosporus]|uniref:Uncharacterized protein n=1 Tax=Streptomyces cuspidosporus TaxID=66882 RepID=A0ABN3GG82_9ACTN
MTRIRSIALAGLTAVASTAALALPAQAGTPTARLTPPSPGSGSG